MLVDTTLDNDYNSLISIPKLGDIVAVAQPAVLAAAPRVQLAARRDGGRMRAEKGVETCEFWSSVKS